MLVTGSYIRNRTTFEMLNTREIRGEDPKRSRDKSLCQKIRGRTELHISRVHVETVPLGRREMAWNK